MVSSPIRTILPGFELSKNKWGVDICLFIVTVITHRQFSIINNGGGLKLTPRGIPGHLVWGGGLSKQLGGSIPPAIQTLNFAIYDDGIFKRCKSYGEPMLAFPKGKNSFLQQCKHYPDARHLKHLKYDKRTLLKTILCDI
jgi:hypothetical protein